MRILVAGRGFDTKTEHSLGVFELDQAKALRAAGHDVRFAAMDTRSIRRTRPLGFYRYECGDIPVFYGSIPCGGLPLGISALAGHIAVRGIFRAVTADGWRPDVIHQHFACDFGAAAKKKCIPFVFTEHSSHHNKLLSPDAATSLRKEYEKADALIAVSSALARNMKRNTGLEAAVIPNIVDADTFCRERQTHEGFVFVSAANLVASKGFSVLLRAVAAIPDPSVRLAIFGTGPEEASLRGLAKELRMEDRVTFRGHCPREALAEAYTMADCFVLPSETETFGLAYVEAMAAGLPVIAARCGGPEDFITPENGILIPVNDVTALENAMREMMMHRDRYDSRAIAEYARSGFSYREIADRLTKLYEGLISC